MCDVGQIYKRRKGDQIVYILLLSKEPGRPWQCAEFYSVGGAIVVGYDDDEFLNFEFIVNIRNILDKKDLPKGEFVNGFLPSSFI